ncbi:MAG: hypothetical protein ACRDN6_11990 [Gaiellaceae bacterium]
MATPTVPPAGPTREDTRAAAPADDCPRCGAACAPFQEYCLECGQRLPVEPRDMRSALSAATGRRGAWYGGEWVWPVLVALLVAILAAAGVVAIQATRDGTSEPFFEAIEPPASPPATETGAGTVPTTTEPAVTLPEEETEPTETEPPPPPPPPGRLTAWPAARNGFTVVLASVPTGGRPAATRKAKEASDAGLQRVGILNSSRYPSLHPGYLVVFSGVYASRAEAERAIETARASGYNDAYAAEVAR